MDRIGGDHQHWTETFLQLQRTQILRRVVYRRVDVVRGAGHILTQMTNQIEGRQECNHRGQCGDQYQIVARLDKLCKFY